MTANKEVVAKRGCTCCGTGCVVLTTIFPLSLALAWETVGVTAAIALWPAVIASAHAFRWSTGRPRYVRYPRLRRSRA